MGNKIKEEMNNIKIPEDLHKRSKTGIMNAKSEMKRTKGRLSNWLPYLATVACLAIIIPIGFSYYSSHKAKTPGHQPTKITKTVTENNASKSKSNTSKAKSKTDTHGLKKGQTLMGGNPVSPAPIPNILGKHYTTSLPVSVVHVKYASQAPKVPSLPSKVNMSVPNALANQLTAYYLPLYGNSGFYIVAPNGMKGNGQVGQDGSYKVSLKNSTGSEVDLSSAGACQGCTIDSAALYFPAARKSAENYGGYHGPYFEKLPVSIKSLNSNTKTFGYTKSTNKQLAGFAYYQPSTSQKANMFLSEVYVDTKQNVQSLAPWILQNTALQNKIPVSNSNPSSSINAT